MTETYFVRFWETERYDINLDTEVVRLVATTPKGSWHSEFPNDGAGKVRERREAFKTYVVGALQAGLEPCEVEIG